MSKLKPYNFRFIKRNNKYIWKNDNMKIVFSGISFQPHDEYAIVKDLSDIMYLYYTVTIYQKIVSYNEKIDDDVEYWKKISQAHAYDFPTLDQLIYMLEKVLSNDISKEECQKITYYTRDNNYNHVPSGRYGYEYRISSEGFDADDYYELTKLTVVDENDNNKETESFSIYIGSGFGSPLSSAGIKWNRLTRKDLKSLLNCVNTFLQDGFNCHNNMLLELASNKKSNYIKYSDKYLFELSEKNRNNIDYIYKIGDVIDYIQIAVGNNEDMHSVDYRNVIISNIDDEYVYVSNGYKEDPKYDYINLDGIEQLPLSRITYTFKNISDELLSLNEEEIASLFYDLCDDGMRQEFASKSVDDLFTKWNDAIAGTCWMYRDEHNFPMYIESKNHHENVKYVIRKVIEKIKVLCNE